MRAKETECAWEDFFKKQKVLNKINKKGIYTLPEKELVKFSLKINENNIPKILKDNEIEILQVAPNKYVLGKFYLREKLPEWSTKDINLVEFPSWLNAIDANNVCARTSIIPLAHYSNIFKKFFNDENLAYIGQIETKSDEFEGYISGKKIKIDGLELKIDGILESKDRIVIIETIDRIADYFSVKDLYYPYRKFKQTVNKPIQAVLLIYSMGVFRVLEYGFKEEKILNSIYLVNDKKYSFESMALTKENLINLLENVKEDDTNNGVVFPQFNDLNKIISVLEQLNIKSTGKDTLKNTFNFDDKQVDACINSLKYLSLVSVKKGNYCLTDKGQGLFELPINKRLMKFIEIIIEKPIFNYLLKISLESDKTLNKYEIKDVLVTFDVVKESSKLDNKTMTAKAWIDWITGLKLI